MSTEPFTNRLLATSRSLKPDESRLGPWRLLRVIGEGEWSRVYLATPIDATESSTADYAIKIIKSEFANDPRWIAMLQREAFLGQQISHPHLSSVLSARIERLPSYLVLPYQSGKTVRQLLASGNRLPVAQATWIARQVAEGLTALHERNWLHGDVKPDNCFVAANGHVTLCDLGFARQFDEFTSCQTWLAGTPAYLAPEFLGERGEVSAASDVYALGIMLYEMVTGSRPFACEDPAELVAAHRLLAPPSPRQLIPDLSANLCRLIRRMLAKEPLRRPTGSQLVDELVDLEIDEFEVRLDPQGAVTSRN